MFEHDHRKLESTMEKRKLFRQLRNNLIAKYEKCSSKHKTGKIKKNIAPVTCQIEIKEDNPIL